MSATTGGTTKTVSPSKQGGWSAVFGCTYKGMALFRILLGVLLTAELVLRFRFLHVYYTDEGYVVVSKATQALEQTRLCRLFVVFSVLARRAASFLFSHNHTI